MDYNNTFIKRADAYTYAVTTYPHVMDNEFKTAVDVCNIQLTDVIINIPAACVPLDMYFQVRPKRYIEYETNKSFAERVNMKYCSFFGIPEPDETIDKIISLASLHHMTVNERDIFYKECRRLLHQNGRFIIGDVQDASKECIWLNEFVNTYNSSGHHGLFWSEADRNLLEQNGFMVDIQLKTYPWIFDTKDAMIDFCKHLFGLDKATDQEIDNGIETYLQPIYINDTYMIEWHLLYFIATKSPVHSLDDRNTTEDPQQV
jgi:hypothetical protein